MIERLFNNFSVSGSKESELLSELKEMSDISSIMKIVPYNLCVCALTNRVTNGWKVIKFYPEEMNLVTIMSGSYLEKNTYIMKYEDFKALGLTNDLISEIENLTFYFEYYDDKAKTESLIIPSPTLQNNILALRGGGKVKADDDPLNQLWVAHNLDDMSDFALIVRKVNKVIKGYAAFAESHTIKRQDEIMNYVLDTLRRLHKDIVVNYYSIDNKRTYVELALPDLKSKVRTDNKKFIIMPAFIYNYSELGDYAASLTSALIINGRVVTVNDMFRVMDDDVEEKITNELIYMNQIMDKIHNTSEDIVDKKENVKRIIKKLGFYSNKVGKYYRNIYEEYMDTFTDKCKKIEVLIEILSIPSVIHIGYMKAENKLMPQYMLDCLGKLSGNVFSIDFDKECF